MTTWQQFADEAELSEVVLTSISDDGEHLVIQTWRPGTPVKRVERR